jgi:hypothetical protein
MNAILKQNWNQILKHGLNYKLPANIDEKVFAEWTEGQKIIFAREGDGNFCVACIDNDDDELFSFMRFFSLGDNTQCSIDFQSDSKEKMMQLLIDLLEKRYCR